MVDAFEAEQLRQQLRRSSASGTDVTRQRPIDRPTRSGNGSGSGGRGAASSHPRFTEVGELILFTVSSYFKASERLFRRRSERLNVLIFYRLNSVLIFSDCRSLYKETRQGARMFRTAVDFSTLRLKVIGDLPKKNRQMRGKKNE